MDADYADDLANISIHAESLLNILEKASRGIGLIEQSSRVLKMALNNLWRLICY